MHIFTPTLIFSVLLQSLTSTHAADVGSSPTSTVSSGGAVASGVSSGPIQFALSAFSRAQSLDKENEGLVLAEGITSLLVELFLQSNNLMSVARSRGGRGAQARLASRYKNFSRNTERSKPIYYDALMLAPERRYALTQCRTMMDGDRVSAAWRWANRVHALSERVLLSQAEVVTSVRRSNELARRISPAIPTFDPNKLLEIFRTRRDDEGLLDRLGQYDGPDGEWAFHSTGIRITSLLSVTRNKLREAALGLQATTDILALNPSTGLMELAPPQGA